MADIESATPFTNYKKKENPKTAICLIRDINIDIRIDINKALSIETYDVSALYTNIPHNELRNSIRELITFSFEIGEKQFIFVTKFDETWTDDKNKFKRTFDKPSPILTINFLLNFNNLNPLGL